MFLSIIYQVGFEGDQILTNEQLLTECTISSFAREAIWENADISKTIVFFFVLDIMKMNGLIK